MTYFKPSLAVFLVAVLVSISMDNRLFAQSAVDNSWAHVTEDDHGIKIETEQLEAVIPKKNPKQWMTGIEKGSFLDKATGFREIGDGLMVVDWLMEAGSDEPYQDQIIAPDGNGVSVYRWYANETDPERRSYAIMAHGIHHRGQLSLMCRLAGGQAPGMYGPNREEMAAMRASTTASGS